jgi:hypothetical protein
MILSSPYVNLARSSLKPCIMLKRTISSPIMCWPEPLPKNKQSFDFQKCDCLGILKNIAFVSAPGRGCACHADWIYVVRPRVRAKEMLENHTPYGRAGPTLSWVGVSPLIAQIHPPHRTIPTDCIKITSPVYFFCIHDCSTYTINFTIFDS